MAFNASADSGLLAKAKSAIWLANFTKSSFFATKSVSQLNCIITPYFLSAEVFAITAPSFASLSALAADTFAPFFLK